jgi:peptide/nickel transport system permease protein
MLIYIARRLLVAVPVLFVITLITFLLVHAAAGTFVPGLDEARPDLKPEDIVRIRHILGVDQPLPAQYLQWLGALLHGDLGNSLIDGQPVTQLILDRLPNTLELTVTAMLLGLVVSIPAGVAAALDRGGKIDQLLTTLSVVGISVPSFWLSLVLVLLFAIQFHAWGLPFLPTSGATSAIGGGDLGDRLVHLVLPASVLALHYVATWSRYTRSSMIEVLSQDFIRTARAKGLGERSVVYVHALRNALIPLVTLVGLQLPGLFSGGAIIEIVFSWPGIGRLALDRALRYDFTTILGLTTVAAIIVVIGNLLADVLYAALDPRIEYK